MTCGLASSTLRLLPYRRRLTLLTKALLPNSVWRTILVCLLVTAARGAQAEPQFGDSNWVAPGTPGTADQGDPTADGPRVAEPDHERTWETVLRTPFRVVFFPLRMLARGMEASANLVEHVAPPRNLGLTAEEPRTHLSPAFSYSGAAGPGVGPSFNATDLFGEDSRLSATGTWSLRDNRRLRVRALLHESAPVGVGFEGVYDYRPNRRFYGMGNETPSERTIHLRRDDVVEGFVLVGRDPIRRVRGAIGISDIKIGNGYNGSGSRHSADAFEPADVPFLTRGSRVWSYGLSGDFGALDRVRDPSYGVHARGEARRVQSTDDTDLKYDAWRIEGRGYLPVFASRRVVALRLAYQGIDPRSGSEPIPFYRLPESSVENRFSAYSSGRFRDRRLLLAHAEYRWILWQRVWAVLLAQRGIVAGSTGTIRYDAMHESYGGALRLRISDARTARLEIANGPDGMNVYVDLKGDF